VKFGKNHGNWKGGTTKQRGYLLLLKPDHPRANGNGYVRENIFIAEKAFGKPLPKGVIVHHHTDTQLVICESQAYHLLLHRRMKALRTCGHANWRKCEICRKYDNPNNLCSNGNHIYHKQCMKKHRHKLYSLKKENLI
jgi:hypothetical protein